MNGSFARASTTDLGRRRRCAQRHPQCPHHLQDRVVARLGAGRQGLEMTSAICGNTGVRHKLLNHSSRLSRSSFIPHVAETSPF
ncbi:MAG: hypothetical protein AW07_02993 [Candidatus Accumulibacter sp. SK-11]|nr:MAG: hypothetical protein AW07_02993 [Candidatus Accumulibacter sp. SK-11]